jgi:SprT protein
MKGLASYLPEHSVAYAEQLLAKSRVLLKISGDRLTKLGDYRPKSSKSPAQITVNNSLNPYAFLITLIHELAHAIAFEDHGKSIQAHGKEWKSTFRELMLPLLNNQVFPVDVLVQLERHMANPKASTGADLKLLRTLRKYDANTTLFLEDIADGSPFQLRNGKRFIKGARRRKNFLCKTLDGRRNYLINPLAEVELLNEATL